MKRSQINASVTNDAKLELEGILAHHYRNGEIKMSMTKILERIIHEEAKRLNISTVAS